MTRRLRTLGGLASTMLAMATTALLTVPAGGVAPAAVDGAGHGVLVPAHTGQVLPARNADTSSLNWSGYAVVGQPGHPITAVTQSWIVPSVSPLPPGFSSTWAGIGGYNTSDLIQAGTESDV